VLSAPQRLIETIFSVLSASVTGAQRSLITISLKWSLIVIAAKLTPKN
jgi:hypothetical protein